MKLHITSAFWRPVTLRRQGGSRRLLINGKRLFALHGIEIVKAHTVDAEDFGDGIIGFHLSYLTLGWHLYQGGGVDHAIDGVRGVTKGTKPGQDRYGSASEVGTSEEVGAQSGTLAKVIDAAEVYSVPNWHYVAPLRRRSQGMALSSLLLSCVQALPEAPHLFSLEFHHSGIGGLVYRKKPRPKDHLRVVIWKDTTDPILFQKALREAEEPSRFPARETQIIDYLNVSDTAEDRQCVNDILAP